MSAASLPKSPRQRLSDLRNRILQRGDRPLDETHPLAMALGLERAKEILEPQPTPLQRLWSARRAIVAQRLAQGVAIKEIAIEMGVTPTRIRQLKKAMEL